MEQVAGPCAIELKGIGLIEVAFLDTFIQLSGFDSSEFQFRKGINLLRQTCLAPGILKTFVCSCKG